MELVQSPDGARIAFFRSGQGPALLLVHGTTADHHRWDGVLPALEEHFTVYAIDRRGRGGSTDAPDYAIQREFEDVAAVVDAIGESVAVLSHSYGSICSLGAARLTRAISRLILYEPPLPTGTPMVPADVPERIQALVDSGEWEQALEVFFREVVRMPEGDLEIFRQQPMWKGRIPLAPTLAREIAVDWTYKFDPEQFSDLQIPVLLLLGRESASQFRQAIEMLHAALPNHEVMVIPGKHAAMDTHREDFLNAVLPFLLNG